MTVCVLGAHSGDTFLVGVCLGTFVVGVLLLPPHPRYCAVAVRTAATAFLSVAAAGLGCFAAASAAFVSGVLVLVLVASADVVFGTALVLAAVVDTVSPAAVAAALVLADVVAALVAAAVIVEGYAGATDPAALSNVSLFPAHFLTELL